jgi:hypothetical protein
VTDEEKEEVALLEDLRASLVELLERTAETAISSGMDRYEFVGVFIATTLAISADLAISNGMSREWFIGKMSTVYDLYDKKYKNEKGEEGDD